MELSNISNLAESSLDYYSSVSYYGGVFTGYYGGILGCYSGAFTAYYGGILGCYCGVKPAG